MSRRKGRRHAPVETPSRSSADTERFSFFVPFGCRSPPHAARAIWCRLEVCRDRAQWCIGSLQRTDPCLQISCQLDQRRTCFRACKLAADHASRGSCSLYQKTPGRRSENASIAGRSVMHNIACPALGRKRLLLGRCLICARRSSRRCHSCLDSQLAKGFEIVRVRLRSKSISVAIQCTLRFEAGICM